MCGESRMHGLTAGGKPRGFFLCSYKMLVYPLPKFHTLPATLPIEGAIRIEIEEGGPILRASKSVQTRIEELIQKNQDFGLTKKESEELDQYEEIDDYLSFFNRVVRNLLRAQSEET